MKKLIFVSLFLVYAAGTFAQDIFDLGIKGGINTSKISVNSSLYTEENVNNYNIGAFARISIGRIYIQPEAYYSSKGGKLIEKVGLSTLNEFDLGVVDVPVLLGLKIINKKALNLRVMAGPMFSYVTSTKVTGDTFTEANIKDSFLGWQYGAGIDFLMFTFDVRAESGGAMITEMPDFKSNRTYVLSLGLKFF